MEKEKRAREDSPDLDDDPDLDGGHKRRRVGSDAGDDTSDPVDQQIADWAQPTIAALKPLGDSQAIAAHSNLAFLFSCITNCDRSLKPEIYDKPVHYFRLLLEEHVDLSDLLAKVVLGQATWKEVRQHPALRAKPRTPPASTRVDGRESDMEATRKAWSRPFVGECHEVVLRAINDMNRTRIATKSYANFVPFVQSSGTGKSRTVDEMAKLVFTLPFNLRHMIGRNGLPADDGWPPGDSSILSFFLAHTSKDLPSRIRSFFTKLFDVVTETAENLSCDKNASFPKAWREYLRADKNRKTLYDRAVNISDYLQCGTNTHVVDAASKLIELINRKSGGSSATKPSGRSDIKLLLYFDESHSLMQNMTDDPLKSPYQILCSTFNDLSSLDCFMLFLSTYSSLSKHSPAHHLWFSARARNEEVDYVQAPIVECVFDVWEEAGIVQEDEITLYDVCKPEFMIRFGRPLFWTRWQEGDMSVRQNIYDFAVMKLSGVRSLSDIQRDGLLAALGVRVLLDFEATRIAAVQTENRLVEAHMRIAFSVPHHREYLRSGSPSEPLLAEAAARIMNAKFSEANDWAKFLMAQIEGGLIDKGQAGELAMRLLLTCAHDKAAILSRNSLGDGILPEWDVPIPLSAFLEALFGQERAGVLFASYPSNLPRESKNSKPFSEVFKDARVRFTHFVKAFDDTVVTDDAMWAALARGMAYQCWNNQELIDIIIPILLWDAKLGRYVVTALFIQVKDTGDPQPPITNIDKFHFFTDKGAPEHALSRPVIVFTANLGVRRHSYQAVRSLTKYSRVQLGRGGESLPKVSYNTPKRPSVAATLETPAGLRTLPGPTREQPSRTDKTKHWPPPTHPCYSFEADGCSPKVYDVIQDNDKQIWPRLLASRDLLDEHPRQTRDALETVLRLKPYWSANLNSYDWVVKNRPDRLHRPAERLSGLDKKADLGAAPASGDVMDEADNEVNSEADVKETFTVHKYRKDEEDTEVPMDVDEERDNE